MLDAKLGTTPADPSLPLHLDDDPFSDPKLYRQTVGSLQYATITHPDISFVVNKVCQFMHAPTTLHWQAVKRILRFLNGILYHCLHFHNHTASSLSTYSESGWILDKVDSHS